MGGNCSVYGALGSRVIRRRAMDRAAMLCISVQRWVHDGRVGAAWKACAHMYAVRALGYHHHACTVYRLKHIAPSAAPTTTPRCLEYTRCSVPVGQMQNGPEPGQIRLRSLDSEQISDKRVCVRDARKSIDALGVIHCRSRRCDNRRRDGRRGRHRYAQGARLLVGHAWFLFLGVYPFLSFACLSQCLMCGEYFFFSGRLFYFCDSFSRRNKLFRPPPGGCIYRYLIHAISPPRNAL